VGDVVRAVLVRLAMARPVPGVTVCVAVFPLATLSCASPLAESARSLFESPALIGALAAGGRVQTWQGYAQLEDATKARTIELASSELNCPTRELHLTEIGGVADVREWAAEGCGKRSLYLRVVDEGEAQRAPGHEGARVLLHLSLVLPLSEGATAAHRITDGLIQDLGLSSSFFAPTLFDMYFDVRGRGARDLECPLEGVTPFVFSRGSMAEGCGKRASYWGDKLACIVPITR
jgi:hypothetical protein